MATDSIQPTVLLGETLFEIMGKMLKRAEFIKLVKLLKMISNRQNAFGIFQEDQNQRLETIMRDAVGRIEKPEGI